MKNRKPSPLALSMRSPSEPGPAAPLLVASLVLLLLLLLWLQGMGLGWLPVPSEGATPTAVRAAALGTFWVGGLIFVGQRPSLALVLLGSGIFLALAFVSLSPDGPSSSALVVGLVVVAVVAMAATLFSRLPVGPGRWLVLSVLAVYGLVLVLERSRVRPDVTAWYDWPLDLALLAATGTTVLVVHLDDARRSAADLADRLRSVFDNAPDPMFRVAVGGRVLEVNRALRTLLDAPPGAEFGPYGAEAHVPPSDPRVIEQLVLERGLVRGFAARLKGRDGREHDVAVDAWLIRDSSGAPAAVEGLMRDLTDEMKLRRRMDQGQRLEALGRLSAGIAHDFNNLLTGVLGAIEFGLRVRRDPDALERELAQARDMILRGSGLTRQLLAFGREQTVETEDLDLDEALGPVLSMLRRVLDSRFEIDVQKAGDLPPVRGSSAQLEQVVTNLVLNARDAMPEGGRVLLRTERTRAGVRLVVADEGLGMDEETLSRVFEPFFTTKAEGIGIGMGLASVYGTVRQLGGDIQVTSEPGVGTEFRIDLPAAQDRVRSRRRAQRAPPQKALQVLVASDVPAVRGYAQRVLEERGHRVTAVGTLEEALRSPHRAPAVVVTEVALPGHSGMELVELMASREHSPAVVYLTGMAGRLLDRGRSGNAVVLAKPFTPEQLLEAVDEAVARTLEEAEGGSP